MSQTPYSDTLFDGVTVLSAKFPTESDDSDDDGDDEDGDGES